MESKAEAVRSSHFEEATVLREWELDLKAELVGPATTATPIALVDTPDIENIVSSATGIPVERMTKHKTKSLSELPNLLSKRIIGQPRAVKAVSKALQRAHCGFRDPKRPMSTLLFSGPTGVGKTSLANEVAQEVFGSKVCSPHTAASCYSALQEVADFAVWRREFMQYFL
jgi:ATP-dependent Clp protease ATP-binding subunit ClpC